MSAQIPVVEKITKANDQIAALNLARLNESNVLALNLMASPGAGKTSLIERTLMLLRDDTRVGVIEGDVTGIVDAMQQHPFGRDACRIGHVESEPKGCVLVDTAIGGTRIVDMPLGRASATYLLTPGCTPNLAPDPQRAFPLLECGRCRH